MSKRHEKTLAAIFAVPTTASLRFEDIEKLLVSLGAEVIEGRGSRVAFELRNEKMFAHRPHPGKEARKYQVETVREFLLLTGFGNG